ncbi:MAG TPA: rod shape-determining protein MreC, partial [Methylophilaceae bacterium]|nr:rod shape-determining protein MreC [Methylophilaceae bacterium]
NNRIDLPYLPPNVDIRQGDKLMTSGIDGVYPAGLAIATVRRIEHDPDSPFARIVCTPVAGIENHKQVLILSLPPASAADDAGNDGEAAQANVANPDSKTKPAHVAP